MLLPGALSKPKPKKTKKFLIFQEMKLPCSNIEKALIFSYKKSCLIFIKTEPCTSHAKQHKIKKSTPKKISYISRNGTFYKIHPRTFLILQKTETQIKLFLYFGKQKSPIFFIFQEMELSELKKWKQNLKCFLYFGKWRFLAPKLAKKIYIFLIFFEKINLSYCSYFF